jgi:hypothetical protein
MHSSMELKFDYVLLDILQVLKIKHTSISYLLKLIVEIWLFFSPCFSQDMVNLAIFLIGSPFEFVKIR